MVLASEPVGGRYRATELPCFYCIKLYVAKVFETYFWLGCELLWFGTLYIRCCVAKEFGTEW